MPDAANRKIPGHGLIWNIAAIAGLAWAGMLAYAVLFFGMAASMPEFSLSLFLVLIVLPIPILIVSIALARKWELISGIVLVIVGVGLMVTATVNEQSIMSPPYCLPTAVVGTLFILSRLVSQGN